MIKSIHKPSSKLTNKWQGRRANFTLSQMNTRRHAQFPVLNVTHTQFDVSDIMLSGLNYANSYTNKNNQNIDTPSPSHLQLYSS